MPDAPHSHCCGTRRRPAAAAGSPCPCSPVPAEQRRVQRGWGGAAAPRRPPPRRGAGPPMAAAAHTWLRDRCRAPPAMLQPPQPGLLPPRLRSPCPARRGSPARRERERLRAGGRGAAAAERHFESPQRPWRAGWRCSLGSAAEAPRERGCGLGTGSEEPPEPRETRLWLRAQEMRLCFKEPRARWEPLFGR